MQKNIYCSCVFLLLYFFIFQPNFIWTSFKDFLIFLPMLAFFLFAKKWSGYTFKINNLLDVSLIIIIGLWSYYLSELNGYDPIFSLVLTKLLFFYAVSCLFWECFKDRFGIDDVLLIVLLCCSLNAVIIVLQFLFPPLLEFLESIQVLTGNIDFAERGYRLRGIAAGGAASLSLMQAVAILIALYLNKINKLSSFKSYILSLLLLWSLVFIARTGFLVGAALIFASLFLTPKNITVFFKVLSLYCCCFVLLNYGFPERVSFFISHALPWSTEYLVVFQGESVHSVNELTEMLYVPKDYSVLLYGAGFFEGDSNNALMRSDSGYLKTMMSVGVILGVIVYSLIIKWLVTLSRVFNDPFNLFFIFPLLIILLVAEVKEPFFYQNYVSRFLMLIIAYRNPFFKSFNKVDMLNKSHYKV